MGSRTSAPVEPPAVPADFWEDETMSAALASRHIGRVVRAFRAHPTHGRHPLPQELVAEWLGTSQSQLSRIENGQHVDSLDVLSHWARVLSIPERYLWFVGPGIEGADRSARSEGLGSRSAARTKAVLEALDGADADGLRYLPPEGLVGTVEEFVASPSRAFVLAGPPGCGKTSATYHVAGRLAGSVDVQLHTIDTWNTLRSDLAAEILRYASLTAGDDALLSLEAASGGLSRPCMVVVDGLASRDQIDDVGRQVDRALRQVDARHLRYLLVVRTPPDVDLAAYPVLAASLFVRPRQRTQVSHELSPWSLTEARAVWDETRGRGALAFSDLPPSLQRLATVPLYARLLKGAGDWRTGRSTDVFSLVDGCVRSILRRSEPDVDRALAALAAEAWRDVGSLAPTMLRDPAGSGAGGDAQSPGRRGAGDGWPPALAHDVVREYLVACHMTRLLVERGTSPVVVAALNELASRAATTAAARGLFAMVVGSLNSAAPELATYVAISPRADATATLPLVAESATGARFATDEVWRSLARRCLSGSGEELARALLASPALADALGTDLARWLVDLLRAFGPALWPEVAGFVEQFVDVVRTRQMRDLLVGGDGATFCARFRSVVLADDGPDDQSMLEDLATHPHWRVRAALAEGLDEADWSTSSGRTLVGRLVGDADYKVRAAVAASIGGAPLDLVREHVPVLLADESWHVRTRLLAAIEGRVDSGGALMGSVTSAVVDDPLWHACPTPAAVALERLSLRHGVSEPSVDARARDRAAFSLLREARTGWAKLPPTVHSAVANAAAGSGRWSVAREASYASAGHDGEGGSAERSASVSYRTLRDQRVVQVALDVPDLGRAVAVAEAAATGGAKLVEVGDPLIKEVGLAAVEAIKRRVPDLLVVAEMMSADWGRDQVVLAAEAGADVAFLIGPASLASVSSAVDAGRRLGVPVVLDVPPGEDAARWVRDMEQAGVDGFAVTTNIDLGVGGSEPFARARRVRSQSRLPVAVSGGFTPADHEILTDPDWDILVVGRSVAEAVRPELAAREIVDVARSTRSLKP